MNNGNQHIKSFNADPTAKNRIKFISAKQRAKQASADVYRSYKRRTGIVTSAASREERVHHSDQFNDSSKSRKKRKTVTSGGETTVVIGNNDFFDDEEEEELELETSTTFQMELDLGRDRNASTLFAKLYHDLAPLLGSLPEILHHAEKIVNILMSYVLSPYSSPQDATVEEMWKFNASMQNRNLFVVNAVTTDVLHLISVLARDLRHEIHPYVHDSILPRIVNDLINPPTTVSDPEMKQQRTLDITVVETAFRALSYIFRYDTNAFLKEDIQSTKKTSKKGINDDVDTEGCLELMRKYYGSTLAHKSDFVRRLGAESFAPLVRKLKSNASRKKHVRRVIRSLATSAAASVSFVSKPPVGQSKDFYEPSIVMDSRLDRGRSDAVDGVAMLLFYVVRGVPGRLHSKSQGILKHIFSNILQTEKEDSSKDWNIECFKKKVTFELVSQVLSKIRGHIKNGSNFSAVWDELYDCLDTAVAAIKNGVTGFCSSLGFLVQLVEECISYRRGALLKAQDGATPEFEQAEAKRISLVLQEIVEPKFYCKLGEKNQGHVLKLLCVAWKVFPNHPSLGHRWSSFIPTIAEGKNTVIDPILVLAKELLPFLSEQLAAGSLVPMILTALAKRTFDKGNNGILVVLHAVATSRLRKNADAEVCIDDKDDLFSTDLALKCSISMTEKETLLDACLQGLITSNIDMNKDRFVRMGYTARIMPFLALIGSDASDEENVAYIEKIAKEIAKTLKILDKSRFDTCLNPDFIVAHSLLVEALAFTLSGILENTANTSSVKNFFDRAGETANNLLLQFPTSLLAVKAAAEIAIVMRTFGLNFNEKPNETFDSLTQNLKANNHFLRMHTLRLLNTFPKRPFVTNFADVDHSEDLDENDYQQKGTVPTPTSSLSGLCEILDTLLQIETTPIGLNNERKLTGAINRVETLGRTGKLPVLYAEAAVNHMFGVMNIKFQPLWSPAVRAIAALSTAHELTVWPSMAAQLKLVMDPDFFNGCASDETGNISVNEASTEEGEMYRDHRLLLNWDRTSGEDASLFQEQVIEAKSCGRVSRHQSTDRITIFEQVWSVLESVPQLTTKKSRVIVPIFLSFLHNQYFLFHNDDPDAREFNLGDHVDSEGDRAPWSRDKLGRKMLQKKLTVFLKMFAEIKGMQQLFKHKLLLIIFESFLSNPDTFIAQLSLSCIHGFKLPHVITHFDKLKGMLAKNQMREVLTKFNLSRENGDVDGEHRAELLPLVIRILFGRLSARGSGAKSSKDSPAARRAAILSFLSGLDASEGELDYFVYMMVRSFIPKNVNMNLSETGHGSNSKIRKMITQVQECVSIEQVASIPMQRQEGFLNLLSEVVKKLGFGVAEFVPIFVKLILGILAYSESLRKQSNVASLDMDIDDTERNIDYDKQLEGGGGNKSGKLRSMCFLRLSDLMSQFAETTNFLDFASELWSVTGPALKNLPNSTINAINAPSLLLLLETMAAHPRLIPLLAQDESCVSAVFQCISESSKLNVVECALRFVDNLLTEGGIYDPSEDPCEITGDNRTGLTLVRKHVDQLIIQFTRRLKSNDESSNPNHLATRELSILCRVTVLLVSEDYIDEGKAQTLATLCGLLLPFLTFARRINERTQLDVLRILSTLLPQIGQDAAFSHLQSFSRLLGPNKSSAGIKSLEIRQQIVACIGAIAANEREGSSDLKKIVQAMQDLNASNSKRLDEWDYERVLPVLNGLCGDCTEERSWFSFTKSKDTSQHGLKVLMPLMYCCLHLLHDTDGVLSRGAYKALSTLIVVASEKQESNISWQRIIETSLMACIRTGFKTHNLAVRRSFVLLLSVVSKTFAPVNSPNLSSDLFVLVRDDEPELDFFLNITHVQIHRRSRALARLRKFLSGFDGMEECTISTQSLTTVLLPLALHPVYECDKKGEEAYAMEAIATVGAITKLLPWGKYQSTLWTALMQVSRHESQERYIISMICSIIDSFHFDVYVPEYESKVDEGNQKEGEDGGRKDFIWGQLNKKLIPTIESFLMKDIVERNGTKNKSLRSPIVLALTKMFLKLPEQIFHLKFPRLLTVICQALKNQDSDQRDIARTTLARVASVVDVKYLSDIVRELAISLNEGYKLHVRTSALHSVLFSISKSYERPEYANSSPLPFDSCVPAMMDIIQQDIFGTASEMKEVDTAKKRLVKEAGGMKSVGSLELIGRMILFRPSSMASSPSNHSSIHALVSPFLSRLHDPEVPPSVIGKVKEAMNRIIIGITQNSSASSEEVLPFAHATVSPFMFVEAEESDDDKDVYDSDEEELKDLEVSKTKLSQKKDNKKEHSNKIVRRVFNWAPSQLKDAKDSASAYEMKIMNKLELRKVLDGKSAPKLTGSSRYDSLKSKGKDLNSPATSCAVSFGLGLLHSHLKKYRSSCNEEMSDPFVRILSQCVKYSKDNSAVLLSLKCLHVLLRLDLPSIPKYRSELAKCILKMLSSMSCNTQNEMVQSGFKTLTLLLAVDRGRAIEYLENTDMYNLPDGQERRNDIGNDPILNKGQMRVLVSILQSALTDAEHHNATFGVIKAITSRQFISPEYYDLMETILKMTVQSQKPTMRQQAAKIFMQYLIEYPMGKQRLETHLKQIVLNTKYEYEDGRISSLELVKAVINKLPLPLLEEYTQLLFLPLVLRLVNDESKQCRERVGECITLLLSRLSTQVLLSLYEYAERWSDDASGVQLRRTSVQLFGLFVDARLDFVKKGGRAEALVSHLSRTLNAEIADVDHTSVLIAKEWEMIYFSLQTFEKISNALPPLVWKEETIWTSIFKCLAHPHPWVQLIASRTVYSHFASCKVSQFEKVSDTAASVLLKIPGSLFEVTRNLCFEINSEEEHQSDDINTMAIKNLSWIINVMDKYPSLCFKNEEARLAITEADEEDDEEEKINNSPVTWLITRLSNIAKKRGTKRREAVFKCFAAFVTVCDASILCNHLELMIEPLNRVVVESEAREENLMYTNQPTNMNSSEVADLPNEVLQLLEDKCGTEIFIEILAAIKSKAREKRDTRKQQIAQEGMQDPEAAAKRRITKQLKEKSRVKRRIEERKIGRGVFTKKPRHHS